MECPAFFTIVGGSFGAQIGIEGVDNVLMIMNQRGMDRLLSDKFEIGAEASAAAARWGATQPPALIGSSRPKSSLIREQGAHLPALRWTEPTCGPTVKRYESCTALT